jgi:hypothetical protein
MAKRKTSKASKSMAVVDYGECYWLWFGLPGVGKWILDPVAILHGVGCKNGGVFVDANTLPKKGDAFLQLLIVSCKPPKGGGAADNSNCSDYSCQFEPLDSAGGKKPSKKGDCPDCSQCGWQVVPPFNDCGGNSGQCNCTCPNPINNDMAKRLQQIKKATGAPATAITWCCAKPVSSKRSSKKTR